MDGPPFDDKKPPMFGEQNPTSSSWGNPHPGGVHAPIDHTGRLMLPDREDSDPYEERGRGEKPDWNPPVGQTSGAPATPEHEAPDPASERPQVPHAGSDDTSVQYAPGPAPCAADRPSSAWKILLWVIAGVIGLAVVILIFRWSMAGADPSDIWPTSGIMQISPAANTVLSLEPSGPASNGAGLPAS